MKTPLSFLAILGHFLQYLGAFFAIAGFVGGTSVAVLTYGSPFAITGIFLAGCGLAMGCILIATGEAVGVLSAIENNTRRAAESAERQEKWLAGQQSKAGASI